MLVFDSFSASFGYNIIVFPRGWGKFFSFLGEYVAKVFHFGAIGGSLGQKAQKPGFFGPGVSRRYIDSLLFFEKCILNIIIFALLS